MNAFELRTHRQITDEFIKADPVPLILLRRTASEDGAGGTIRGDEAEIEEQVFRIIPANDQTPFVQTTDGTQRSPTFVLLARWDADMELWDEFEFKGHRYQIANPIRPAHTEDAVDLKADVILL